jgi:uncharacterized cupredoxin-like copper-binding protein
MKSIPRLPRALSLLAAAGGSQTLTVTLQKGSYQFSCSVPGHKQAGMLDTITVG